MVKDFDRKTMKTVSFDSIESIQKLVIELTNLRNILKCPICLDIINDPIQISCGHIFCEGCLDTHKEGTTLKPTCPVCKKIINRQKKKPRDKIEHLSMFLKGISEKSKNLLGCDILSTEKIVNSKNKRKAQTTSNLQQATVSKSTKSGPLKIRKSCDEQENYQNKTKRDAFDVLMEQSTVNPFFKKNIKTYSRHNKVNKDIYPGLIDFEDDKYKLKIIEWLYDNRNEFDRLTQVTETNNNDDDSLSASSFDMPSVSQVQDYIVNSRNDAPRTRRTQSLDAKVNKVSKAAPKILKSHSFSEGSQNDVENMNIEEVESEDNMLEQDQVDILHMLEENCLNTIETEMLIKQNDKSEPHTSESKPKCNTKNSKNVTKCTTDTGWTRIKKMKKTISKNDRKPKKLQVSLTSSAKREENNISTMMTKRCKPTKDGETKNPIVILEKFNCEIELRKANSEEIIESSNKIYPVKDIESFISKNIQNCISIKKGTSTEIQITENKNKDVVENCDNVKTTTGNEKENNQIEQVNNIENKDENKGSDELWNFLCSQNNKEKKNVRDGISLIDVSDETDLFEIQTQKVTESDVDPIEKSLIALFSSQESSKNSKSPNKSNDINSKIQEGIDIINNFEEKQTTYGSSNIKVFVTKLKTVLNDLKSMDLSFSSAAVSSAKKENLKNYLNSTTQTLVDATSIAIQTDAYESSGFKISSTADFKTINKETVAVQTDDICSTPNSVTSGSDVPSEVILSNEQMLNNFFRQNYEFTQSMDNIDFDTQAALSRTKTKSNTEVQEPSVLENEQRSAKKRLTYNYPPLDEEIDVEDGNLDENEGNITVISIESESGLNLGNKNAVDNSNRSNEITINQDEIEGNVTVISIESESALNLRNNNAVDNSNKPNEITIVQENVQGETRSTSNLIFSLNNESNETTAPTKAYKRLRIPDDDDVYTEEIVKKIKRKEENPYIVDNLSVEILSADENMEEDNPQTASDSASVNYDDYLDRILRQYKSNCNSRTSTQKKETHESTSKQTESQKIIKKCDELIKKATAVTPISKKEDTCNKYTMEINGILQAEFELPFEENANENQNSTNLLSKKHENFSESIFKSQVPNISSEPPFSNQDILAEEFSTELELPNKSVFSRNKSVGEINVLQNVLLQQEENNDDSSELRYNLEEELEKLENRDEGSVKSEEIFNDSSDVDIIETTPQKAEPLKSILRASQFHRQSTSQNLIEPPSFDNNSPDIISSVDTPYLNAIFAPPFEFQDYNNDNKENTLDKTLVPEAEPDEDGVDLTLVEDLINQDQNMTEIQLNNDSQLLSCSFVLSTAKWNLPNTNSFLGKSIRQVENKNKTMNLTEEIKENKSQFLQGLSLSPIKRKPIDLNPIERALQSNYSPLEIVNVKSQPKKTLPAYTSTPRQKSILNYIKNKTSGKIDTSQTASTTQITPYQREKPCIACTRLTKAQIISISELTNKKLATYSSTFSPSVTHMIVAVNNNKCVKDHTMKFIFAVAAGIWILSFDWIHECLVQNQIVPEEEYEVLDVSGKPGPKISRLSGRKNKILQNFRIHVTSPFLSTTKQDMEDLISILGGEIVPSIEDLRENRGIRLIISEAKASQSFEIFEVWLEQLKVLSVDLEWLSRSVSQYELLSLKPFLLCSDDTINDLNYPPELTHDMPYSFSQSIHNG